MIIGTQKATVTRDTILATFRRLASVPTSKFPCSRFHGAINFMPRASKLLPPWYCRDSCRQYTPGTPPWRPKCCRPSPPFPAGTGHPSGKQGGMLKEVLRAFLAVGLALHGTPAPLRNHTRTSLHSPFLTYGNYDTRKGRREKGRGMH